MPTKLADHTILVGYGRVGSLVGAALTKAGIPFLVIEDGDKPLTRLRSEGVETIVGNAADENVFAAARPAAAARLILAVPNAFEAGQVIARARAVNPGIKIAARAHSEAEVEHLTGLGADTVIMGEREIARGIVEAVLSDNPADRGRTPISPRLDVLAAIDVDFRAGDVGRLAGAQEEDDVGDLRGRAQPAQRDRSATILSVPGDRMAVSISPGAMALTRMPCGPKSAAISRVSEPSAALEVA